MQGPEGGEHLIGPSHPPAITLNSAGALPHNAPLHYPALSALPPAAHPADSEHNCLSAAFLGPYNSDDGLMTAPVSGSTIPCNTAQRHFIRYCLATRVFKYDTALLVNLEGVEDRRGNGGRAWILSAA